MHRRMGPGNPLNGSRILNGRAQDQGDGSDGLLGEDPTRVRCDQIRAPVMIEIPYVHVGRAYFERISCNRRALHFRWRARDLNRPTVQDARKSKHHREHQHGSFQRTLARAILRSRSSGAGADATEQLEVASPVQPLTPTRARSGRSLEAVGTSLQNGRRCE